MVLRGSALPLTRKFEAGQRKQDYLQPQGVLAKEAKSPSVLFPWLESKREAQRRHPQNLEASKSHGSDCLEETIAAQLGGQRH